MSEENKGVEQAEVTEPQYSETETRAMELGWKPEDQWVEDGNSAKDHRSAKDFLERGEMIGKLRAQDRELQQQRLALQKIAEKSQKIYENGYKSALDDLKVQKREAARAGDIEKVEDLNDEIRDTERKLEKLEKEDPIPQGPQPDPQFDVWVEQNPWYRDSTMMKFADSLAATYIQENRGQVTPAQVRDFVTNVVKKEFAHRFPKKVTAAPNPDGGGKQSGKDSGTNTQLSKVKAGMSEEERSIMKTLVKATGMTEEAYLKQYASL